MCFLLCYACVACPACLCLQAADRKSLDPCLLAPRTVSQVSRVAVIGANGAGKSTAIKVLVGEQLPTEGTIWKAQGLRMAYVAQHAFHHLEKHMQETPTQYIMWRFAGNDDRESMEFKTEDLSVDEEKARAQKWCIDSVTGNVRRCTDPKEDAKPLGPVTDDVVAFYTSACATWTGADLLEEGQAGRGRSGDPRCHCEPTSEEEGEDLRVRGVLPPAFCPCVASTCLSSYVTAHG